MISKIVTEEFIKLNVECKNWEDAIRKAGEVLLNNKCVTNEFIEKSIENVKELGPYTVIQKGIAMPHSTSHTGIIETGISIISLKTPVNFGNEENDPVYYIFMVAVKDMLEHIKVLSELAGLLSNPDFINTIKNSKDKKNIIDYIKAKEEKNND